MARVAVVRDGVVDNVVAAASVQVLQGPAFAEVMAGAVPVLVQASQVCGPGWSYDAGRSPKFQAPPEPEPVEED
jgi:hypothetical protein